MSKDLQAPVQAPRYDADDLSAAVETLRRGGIIIYPTDTVWGIGCDATNEEAVARIKALKGRADAKALITLVSDAAMLERWVDDVPDVALELIEATEEGSRPVTIVYDHPSRLLAPGLLAPDGTAGIRVCRDPYAAALCRRLRRPVVSTSANFSGQPTPTSFAEIDPALIAGADYTARYRRDDRSAARPSSVIRISAGGLFKILRP